MDNIEREKEKYWLAPSRLQDLVYTLYSKVRSDLEGIPRIVCIFKPKVTFSKGRLVIASIKSISEKENVIHSEDRLDCEREPINYCLEIAADAWSGLTTVQKEAVIVHELFHIHQKVKDREIVWGIRGHELEEFSGVLQRYGYYLPDVKDFLNNVQNCEEVEPDSTWLDFHRKPI